MMSCWDDDNRDFETREESPVNGGCGHSDHSVTAQAKHFGWLLLAAAVIGAGMLVTAILK